mmetsp:Transcript_30460/g.84006  ORF Transcript_30460/g.84006 Transcript_30460/m.84006 type:complete len:407 (+) Transcript_30460:222-1442(+)
MACTIHQEAALRLNEVRVVRRDIADVPQPATQGRHLILLERAQVLHDPQLLATLRRPPQQAAVEMPHWRAVDKDEADPAAGPTRQLHRREHEPLKAPCLGLVVAREPLVHEGPDAGGQDRRHHLWRLLHLLRHQQPRPAAGYLHVQPSMVAGAVERLPWDDGGLGHQRLGDLQHGPVERPMEGVPGDVSVHEPEVVVLYRQGQIDVAPDLGFAVRAGAFEHHVPRFVSEPGPLRPRLCDAVQHEEPEMENVVPGIREQPLEEVAHCGHRCVVRDHRRHDQHPQRRALVGDGPELRRGRPLSFQPLGPIGRSGQSRAGQVHTHRHLRRDAPAARFAAHLHRQAAFLGAVCVQLRRPAPLQQAALFCVLAGASPLSRCARPAPEQGQRQHAKAATPQRHWPGGPRRGA